MHGRGGRSERGQGRPAWQVFDVLGAFAAFDLEQARRVVFRDVLGDGAPALAGVFAGLRGHDRKVISVGDEPVGVDRAQQVAFAGLAGHGDDHCVVSPLAGVVGVELASDVGDRLLPGHEGLAADGFRDVPDDGTQGGVGRGAAGGEFRRAAAHEASASLVMAAMVASSVSNAEPVSAAGSGRASRPS